jgi:hypothetical protein
MSNIPETNRPPKPNSNLNLKGLILWTEWGMEWILYILRQMAIFEILNILSKLSILVGFIFFVTEAGDRKEQKHLEAWRVIVSMRDQPGNGGRIGALQSLNADKVSLTGIEAKKAYLSQINLKDANLQEANFSGSKLFKANFEKATLYGAIFGCTSEGKCTDLLQAKFQGANLSKANLSGDLRGTNFVDANLSDAHLVKVDLQGADLERTILKGTHLECVKGLTPDQVKLSA